MKNNRLIITLCMVFALISAKAQFVSGISVNNDKEEIIVLLNGQTMCNSTHSCFIANLQPGTYRLQVYSTQENDKKFSAQYLLYNEKIKYDGRSILSVEIGNEYSDNEAKHESGNIEVMSKSSFRNFCKSLEDANFDNQRLEKIDILPSNVRFTSSQSCALIRIFDFDAAKITLLERIYPRVVDKENFFKAIDLLEFSSSQNDVANFIKKYNQRHSHSRK